MVFTGSTQLILMKRVKRCQKGKFARIRGMTGIEFFQVIINTIILQLCFVCLVRTRTRRCDWKEFELLQGEPPIYITRLCYAKSTPVPASPSSESLPQCSSFLSNTVTSCACIFCISGIDDWEAN